MPRIHPVDRQTASSSTAQLLDSVGQKLGGVPNLISTMAHSTAAARAYLRFSQPLLGEQVPDRLREQIALVGGRDERPRLSRGGAHGSRQGDRAVGTGNLRRPASARPGRQETAPLTFARSVVRERGVVPGDESEPVRQAGYTDGEIAEIVANVALNLFTNDFNHVARTEVDFPAVREMAGYSTAVLAPSPANGDRPWHILEKKPNR